MNKQTRFWLSLLFLMFVGLPSLSAFAAETRTYTVKRGDTLWGISERFITDPYYWPNLWAHNPEITNPHLIYPGQNIRLYNGRIELIPEYPAPQPASTPTPAPAPAVVQAPAVEETAPQPVAQVELMRTAGSGDGFIKTDEIPLGTLVDSVDARTLLTKNDLVFLHMTDLAQVKIGDTYSIFGHGKKIIHPLTKKPFGTMMFELGFLQVTEIKGGTVVAKIGDVYREIERGAEIYEYVEAPREIELKKAQGELVGHILSGQQEKLTQGQNDIVYVDLGRDNGLQVGNLIYISRPREATPLAGREKKLLELPDELLGAAVVVEVRKQSAAALVFKSVHEMEIGDQVMAATE